jgi:peptidyl-prolyl cis-trans isomerase D
MIKFMRSSKFFTVFLLSAITIMIIISFVFWGIGPYDNPSVNIVARVGDNKITYQEYLKTHDRLFDRYRENIKDDEELKKLNLKEMALDQLIEKNVLLVVAEREGITATEKEFHQALMEEPAFQKDGVFNKDIYLRVLDMNRLTHESYKELMMEQIKLDKLQTLVTETAELSGKEVENLKLDEKQGRQIRDILLSSKKAQALQNYLKGIRQTLNITINKEMI